MIRTQVGYAGGQRPNPTYHSLGDHAEAIQIEYDPADLVASTAVARVNGYLGGYGSAASLRAELESLGLSPAGQEILLKKVSIYSP